MNRKTLLGFALALVAASASALVQPMRINFQGKLIDPTTNNPRTGPVSLKFCLYNDPSAGTCAAGAFYTETQANVPLTNGVFSVEIGTQTALSRDLFLGASVYLGVTVTNPLDAAGEMIPRQNLVMSAYAFTANQLSDLNEVRLIAGPTYSTFTSAGNFTVPAGIVGSSGTFANGITASSGTFLAGGNNQYSIYSASGIYMSSGTLNINGGGGINNQYGIVTATITASSATFTAIGSGTGYGLTVSSGIQMNNGTLDVNGGGGITNTYGIVSGSGTFLATGAGQFSITTSSGIQMNAGTLNLTGTSGIRADDTGIVISTIDFTGLPTDPNGNAGYMYYNTSTGSIKVLDGSGKWNYVFGQSLDSQMFSTTNNTAATAAKAANATILVTPFFLSHPLMVNQMRMRVTTALGVAGDLGVYNSAGTLILNGGASTLTTTAGAKTVAPVQTGGTRFLIPGQYYAAATWNSTTGIVGGDNLGVAGVMNRVGTVLGGGTTLPASITPSAITAGTVLIYFELNP